MRFLILFLLAALPTAAQTSADPLPALRHALAAARADSARGRLNWALSELVESSDSTTYYAQQAVGQLERALPATAAGTPEHRRLQRLLGGALNNLAVGYSDSGHEAQARPYYLQAARLRALGGDVRGQVESLGNLAGHYYLQSDYTAALRYYRQGVAAGAGVPAAHSQVAQCYSGLGDIYAVLDGPAAALRYQLQALALVEHDGEPLTLLNNLYKVASAYNSCHDTARAEAYARRAQHLAARTPNAGDVLILALVKRAEIARQQHRLPAARTLLLAARTQARRADAVIRLAEIQNSLAEVEEAAGQLPLALTYARQAAAYAARNTLPNKRDNQQLLARLCEHLGQPQAALDHYRRYINLRDSANNEASQKQALQQHLSEGYTRRAASLRAIQAQRQAVAAAEIRRQKQLRGATSIGALLLLGLAGVLYNRFRFQRRARRHIEVQKERVEREKQRSDELLRNILPAEVVEELKDTGTTLARHFDVVTVLFADVVDFTQLAERLSPEQLVATLDSYFRPSMPSPAASGWRKSKPSATATCWPVAWARAWPPTRPTWCAGPWPCWPWWKACGPSAPPRACPASRCALACTPGRWWRAWWASASLPTTSGAIP